MSAKCFHLGTSSVAAQSVACDFEASLGPGQSFSNKGATVLPLREREVQAASNVLKKLDYVETSLLIHSLMATLNLLC